MKTVKGTSNISDEEHGLFYNGKTFRFVGFFAHSEVGFSLWAIDPYPRPEKLEIDLFNSGLGTDRSFIKKIGESAKGYVPLSYFDELLFLVVKTGKTEKYLHKTAKAFN